MRPPQASSVVQMSTIAQIGSNPRPKSFIIRTQIQVNGVALSVKALCDTGADISLLISPAIAKQAAERLGARLQRLKTPLLLSDYRKQDAGRITHKLKATLEIDGRRFSNQMFYVTESGHDMFIGQDWLVEQDVWIHPKTQTFAWPERTPSLAKFSPAIRLPNMLDKPDPVAQADAERRDRAFERETKRVQILRRPWRQTTFLEPRPTTPVVLGEDRDVVNIAAL